MLSKERIEAFQRTSYAPTTRVKVVGKKQKKRVASFSPAKLLAPIYRRENLPYNLFGFFLGRALILGQLSPFALPYFVSLRVKECERDKGAAFFLLLGTLTLGDWWRGLGLLLSLLGVYFLLPRLLRVGEGRTWKAAVITLVLSLIVRIPFLLVTEMTSANLFNIALEAILATLATGIFMYALPLFNLSLSDYRVLRVEEIFAALLLVGAALLGLAPIALSGIRFAGVLISLVTLIFAYLGGGPQGATAGIITGVLTSLAGLTPGAIGLYAFGGLMAGLLRGSPKVWPALAYLASFLVLSLYLDSSSEMTSLLAESLLAAGTFLVLPRRYLAWPARYFPGTPENTQAMTDHEERIRVLTSQRLGEFAGLFKELSHSFQQTAVAVEPEKQEALPRFFSTVAVRVCENCNMYRPCWEKDFYKTYKTIFDLWSLAELHGSLKAQEVPEELRRRCLRLGEVISTINYLIELSRLNKEWQERLREARGVVAEQLRGVSQIIDGLAREIRENVRFNTNIWETSLLPSRTLSYEVGVARRAKGGNIISGDSYLYKELPDEKLLLLLSDGMGTGTRAAMESQATVAMLEQLMETGFHRDVAVRTVNAILLLRSPEDMFTTVDLTVVDLKSGETEFLKIGASPSFIKQGDRVSIVRSASLPMGILKDVDGEEAKKTLTAGDLIVIVSDGLLDSRRDLTKKEDWVAAFLNRLKATEAREVAEALVDKAVANYKNEVPDDMTAMVVRLVSAGNNRPLGDR
ncbi:MAG: SpoIIE family protein phosphatase [Firmicutes bacterium]|nr:SpoIIE family protein phosphatase [Bacillota bacterium]